MRLSRLKTPLRYAVVAGIVFYILRSIFLGFQEIIKYEFHFSTLFVLISLPLFMAAYAVPVYAWLILLKGQGFSNVSFFSAYRIWFYSFMGRYLPGKVAVVLVRAKMVEKYAIPASVIANTSMAEICLMLCSSIFLSTPLILMRHREFLWPGVVCFSISAIVILLLQSKGLVEFLGKVSPRLARLKPLSLPFGGAVQVVFLYMGFWLIMGGAFIAFLSSIVVVDLAQIPKLVADYTLSFCGGMLAVFTPSGLGVREVLFAELLQPRYNAEIAMVISVAARLWSTICEIFFVLVIWAVQRIFSESA